MATRFAPFAIVAALAAAHVAAQGTTWIVSASGGPGVHFTTLPEAVAASTDGDTILVRAGWYQQGFTTGKALTVLGEGWVAIDGSVTVQGLPAGSVFTMKRLQINHGATSPGVLLQDNAGRIHAEDVSATLTELASFVSVGSVQAVNCTEVSWTGGTFSGRPGLRVVNALVVLTSVQVSGQDSTHSLLFPSEGISFQGNTLYLSRTTVRGGNGGFLTHLPQPAIWMWGGRVILTGDQTSVIRGGAPGMSGAAGAEAIRANGGIVEVDSLVPLLTSGGAPEITGAFVVRRRIVSLTARGAPPGGTLSVELVSPAGDPIHLLASVPANPVPHPAGTVFIDPRILLPLALTLQGPTEHFALQLTVPNIPALRGGVIAFQAGNFYRATQQLEFSNPAIVVLH